MDRILIAAAYWIYASRYHSGMGSPGYPKLCQLARLKYEPGLASWEHEKGGDERNAAACAFVEAQASKSNSHGDA